LRQLSLVRFLIKPFEVLYNVSKIVFSAIKMGLATILLPISELIGGISSLASSFGIDSPLIAALDEFKNIGRENILSISDEFNQAFDGIGNLDFSKSIESILEDFEKVALSSQSSGKAVKEGFAEGIKGSVEALKKGADEINKIIDGSLKNLISVSMQSIGASLVKGSSAFGDFRKAVLNIIGDMLIQIGLSMITLGAAIDAVRVALMTLFGGSSVAAGLAMIALGGALKAMAGSGLAAAATSGASGASVGISPDEGMADTTLASEDIEREAPKREINIVVQGNILNNRDSALHLVEILNEAYDQEGVQIRGALA